MEHFSVSPAIINEFLNNTKASHYFSLTRQFDTQNIFSSGRWDLGRYFDNTAIVSIKDLHIKRAFYAETTLENLITIDIVLEGGVHTLVDHFIIPNNDMPRVLFGSHNESGYQQRIHHEDEHYKAVGIWIKPQVLIDNFGLELDKFPQVTAELLQGKYNRSLLLPITSKIKQCAEEILETRITSKLKEKFIEAKLTELFYYLIECLLSPEQSFNLSNHLSTRKSKAMKKILARLNDDNIEEINLTTLAKEVGMSESHLSKTFKSSYGMNLSQYRLQQRLVKAFELIVEGKLSIFQVAMEVGYRDQSSFARAFKNHFGFSPTKVGSDI
ncbi:MAG: helix-turn-helix transcriptional regulator [Glaciecola sp.]|jgi:AraC-like DNA-binding protein